MLTGTHYLSVNARCSRGVAHGAEVEEGAFGIPPVLDIEADDPVVVMFRTNGQSRIRREQPG